MHYNAEEKLDEPLVKFFKPLRYWPKYLMKQAWRLMFFVTRHLFEMPGALENCQADLRAARQKLQLATKTLECKHIVKGIVARG